MPQRFSCLLSSSLCSRCFLILYRYVLPKFGEVLYDSVEYLFYATDWIFLSHLSPIPIIWSFVFLFYFHHVPHILFVSFLFNFFVFVFYVPCLFLDSVIFKFFSFIIYPDYDFLLLLIHPQLPSHHLNTLPFFLSLEDEQPSNG